MHKCLFWGQVTYSVTCLEHQSGTLQVTSRRQIYKSNTTHTSVSANGRHASLQYYCNIEGPPRRQWILVFKMYNGEVGELKSVDTVLHCTAAQAWTDSVTGTFVRRQPVSVFGNSTQHASWRSLDRAVAVS